jgi:hypothetical protein
MPSPTRVKTVHPSCPECQGIQFEIRVKKDEQVATAKCMNCDRHYLMLDSQDYWFDVIQRGYPRVSRCSCRGTMSCLR